jgi:hypothetical protein
MDSPTQTVLESQGPQDHSVRNGRGEAPERRQPSDADAGCPNGPLLTEDDRLMTREDFLRYGCKCTG